MMIFIVKLGNILENEVHIYLLQYFIGFLGFSVTIIDNP